MNKLRIGILGMGMMGEMHTVVYKALPDVEIVGFVEPDEQRAALISGRYGVRAFPDTAELLDQVDAASICTPDDLHEDIALQALKKNVKILVEKTAGGHF
jgi:Predicted dehydrogenases and related proteins